MGLNWGRAAVMMQTVKGAYRLQVFGNSELLADTGEFDNLITDTALTLGDPFSSGFLCVGTGDRPPAVTDNSLENELANASASFTSSSVIFMQGANRYAKRSVTATFTGLSGDIAEVGFRGAAADSVRSRSLVRDGNGLATIIPIAPSQTLKISYFVYVLIPDVLATGTVSTPYGSSVFTIKPHDELTEPAGILAGRFNNPFAGEKLRAMLDGSGHIDSASFVWVYDAETQTATAAVNFAATETNRTVTGFQAANNETDLPIITLTRPLLNPANNDIGFKLSFSWGRA